MCVQHRGDLLALRKPRPNISKPMLSLTLSLSRSLSLSLSGFFGSSLLLSKDEARIAG